MIPYANVTYSLDCIYKSEDLLAGYTKNIFVDRKPSSSSQKIPLPHMPSMIQNNWPHHTRYSAHQTRNSNHGDESPPLA
ncbi:hypothetical protein [Absidia glauca]|uniref:Uncharacterized protein n=1 Tax=Absidia glauca TaxID=4829 RepID=A0A163J5Y2_ABSGL|nr:hypothetical protein [Absidia glauca]